MRARWKASTPRLERGVCSTQYKYRTSIVVRDRISSLQLYMQFEGAMLSSRKVAIILILRTHTPLDPPSQTQIPIRLRHFHTFQLICPCNELHE